MIHLRASPPPVTLQRETAADARLGRCLGGWRALTALNIERARGSPGYLPGVALEVLFDALATGELSQAGMT